MDQTTNIIDTESRRPSIPAGMENAPAKDIVDYLFSNIQCRTHLYIGDSHKLSTVSITGCFTFEYGHAIMTTT